MPAIALCKPGVGNQFENSVEAAMSRFLAAILIVTLAACSQGAGQVSSRAAIAPLQVNAELPAGPPMQYRAAMSVPFEFKLTVNGQDATLFGTATSVEVSPNCFRVTYVVNRTAFGGASGTASSGRSVTYVPNLLSRPFIVDGSGKYLLIEPPTLPSGNATADAVRTALARNWASLLTAFESLPVYRGSLALGSIITPTTLDELFDKRVELLEAMVRGNTGGFWGELPRNGTMTQPERDALTATIRARTMPTSYESDVRVRGTTTYGGRTYVLASGTERQTLRAGRLSVSTVEHLIDPVSGLVAVSRFTTSGDENTVVRATPVIFNFSPNQPVRYPYPDRN
jgi:hypothetical protein